MSPALAQVNGPGPSPANLFDTVLNLPGDEAVITGINEESIGGVEGQTTQLNIGEGGKVGIFFNANFSSEVNITGGTLGNGFQANSGSEVNILGGAVGGGGDANSGSLVNISGGTVDRGLIAHADSVVKISGGSVGGLFFAEQGSEVELIGGEFRLNGSNFTGDTITLTDQFVFSGILADGSPVVFSSLTDRLNDLTLTVVDLPPLDTNPITINAPIASGPLGLRPGQRLTVVEGGFIGDHFAVIDATLNVEAGTLGIGAQVCNSEVNISGGIVGSSFEALIGSVVNISGGIVLGFLKALGSEVNITGGSLGNHSFALSGSVVNISGGTLGSRFSALDGSVVNISGGNVGDVLGAKRGSVVNISGGLVGSRFDADTGSRVNISGGTVGSRFSADPGSEVNLSGGALDKSFDAWPGSVVNILGSEFSIDGTLLNNMQTGQSVTITDRDVNLSGVLTDGEAFSFDLNPDFDIFNQQGYVSADATLTVTLVAPVILGDVNQDGVVNFLDIAAFIAVLARSEFNADADIDQNGEVNFLDIAPFIAILSGN